MSSLQSLMLIKLLLMISWNYLLGATGNVARCIFCEISWIIYQQSVKKSLIKN